MTGIPESVLQDLSALNTDVDQHRRLGDSPELPVRGFDCETHEGDIFLICDSDGNCLDQITPINIIKFLYKRKNQNCWNWFFNITYDAEAIIKAIFGDYLTFVPKYLRKDIKVDLVKMKFVYFGYRIWYIPKKQLSVSIKGRSAIFYDVAQFARGNLLSACEEKGIPVSEDDKNFKNKRMLFSPRYYNRHKKMLRQYCINDCVYTKKLAENWIKSFNKRCGFLLKRWISTAYVAEKTVAHEKTNLPLFDSLAYAQQEFIYACSFGGRFEMCKRGFIGYTWTYDVNSAYPNSMRNLPDFTNGYWVQDKTIHPLAAAGFFEIECNIPEDVYIAPFPFMIKNKLIFPTGRFITRATLPELKACRNPNWYRILSSEQFIPYTNFKPLKHMMESLYTERQKLKSKGDSSEHVLKIILNSTYGKFGATNKTNNRIGSMFFPPIFAAILGDTRAKLYDFVISNNLEKYVVGFATDSVILTKELDLPETKDLGKFSLQKSASDTFYLQNGINRMNGVWKRRGIGTLDGKKVENFKIVEKRDKVFLILKVLKNTRLLSGSKFNNVTDIGWLKKDTKEINLNADRGRLWNGLLKSVKGTEFNDSVPVSTNHFNGNEGFKVEK